MTDYPSDRRYEDCKTEEEAEAHLQNVAKRLEQRYGQIPFYADREKRDPGYWRGLASSEVNA